MHAIPVYNLENISNIRKKKKYILNGRLRANWIEEEKPKTKNCNMELRNYSRKLIFRIELDNGKII